MTVRSYFELLRRSWRVLSGCLFASLLVATVAFICAPREYESRTTFYVSSPSSANAGAGAVYSVSKLPSLAALASSDFMATQVTSTTGVNLTRQQISQRISATTNVARVHVIVAVRDTDRQRAELISSAIAREFDHVVNKVENTEKLQHLRVTMTSGPTAPTQVAPKLRMFLLSGIGVGFAVGLLWTWGIALLDKKVRSASDLSRASQLPLLAEAEHFDAHPERLLVDAPRSTAADTIRLIRAQVASPGDNGTKVVAVSSAASGDGKSTLATSLALAWAESGERVVLVDADLRKRGLAPLLGLQESPGVSDLLAASQEVQVQHWEGIDVVPAGSPLEQPGSYLSGAGFTALLAKLTMAYQRVVLDTAPILPLPDALDCVTRSDRVVLVARVNLSELDDIERAVQLLSAVDVPVVGAVLVADRSPQ